MKQNIFNYNALIIVPLLVVSPVRAGSAKPPIELCTVENRTKKNLEICTGRLSIAGVLFNLVDQIRLRMIEANKVNELKSFLLKEDTDYFLKDPKDGSNMLKFGYSVIEGNTKKMLSFILVRYVRSFKVGADGFVERIYEKPNFNSKDFDLDKMQAHGTLHKILLRVIVDGDLLEKSKIEIVPVYEQN